jgi:hypothetical protein
MTDIEAILKATIQAKVIEAFNTAPDVVEKLVEAALSKEVDQHGNKPDYTSKKMPYMEWLVGNEIRNAVCACVREYVEQNGDEIRARVKLAMESSDFIKPMADTIAEVLGKTYNWTVDLKIAKD